MTDYWRRFIRCASVLLSIVLMAGALGCSKSPQELYKDGLMELERKNLDAAQERFEAAVAADPTQVNAYKHLIRIYEMKKDTPKTIEALKHLIEQQPFNNEAQTQLAGIYLREGRFEEGHAIYRDLASSAVNAQEKARFERLLEVLQVARERQERIGELKKQLGEDPENPAISLELGGLYFKVGQNLALAGQNDNGKDYLNQSRILLDRARERYEENLQASPESAEAKIGLASSYFELSQHYLFSTDAESAIGQLKKAIEIAPEISKYHFVLSQLYGAQKKNQEAIKSIRKAIELEPGMPLYQETLSRYLAAEDDLEGSLKALKEADRAEPGTGKYLFQMAVLYEKNNKPRPQIIELLEQAVEREPNSAQYRFSLAGFLGQEKRYDESLAQLKEVVKLGRGSRWEQLAQQMIQRTEADKAAEAKE